MRQELACSDCGRRLVFDMNFSQDGNHEITCPACGHVHYRVVRNGQITGDRWQAAMQTFMATNITVYSGGTTCDTWASNMNVGTATQFMRFSWLQTGTGG